ncbi:MAG: D-alanyl-D-alanine carboxypeptidase family protein [Streptosporangiaceae bacterium]
MASFRVWTLCGRCARYLGGTLSVVALAAAVTWATSVPSFAAVAPPGVTSSGAAIGTGPGVAVLAGELADAGNGAQLWGQDATVRRPMGSITKVMTALVVLRAGDLSRKITVTQAAVSYVRHNGESRAGLIVGDVLTTRQLLDAMLLPSGGDAAYLLASAYGPGLSAFIARMNALAAALGMASTHFASFDGMPVPTEYSTYSTPANLIRLGEQAMARPVFRQVVDQSRYVLPAGPGHHRYVWVQTDKLIGSYPGAIGIKTGYTGAAGNCLLFEARRGNLTLIGVVLHAGLATDRNSAIADARQVLDWGFARAG